MTPRTSDRSLTRSVDQYNTTSRNSKEEGGENKEQGPSPIEPRLLQNHCLDSRPTETERWWWQLVMTFILQNDCASDDPSISPYCGNKRTNVGVVVCSAFCLEREVGKSPFKGTFVVAANPINCPLPCE